jgi:hypothetical protein
MAALTIANYGRNASLQRHEADECYYGSKNGSAEVAMGHPVLFILVCDLTAAHWHATSITLTHITWRHQLTATLRVRIRVRQARPQKNCDPAPKSHQTQYSYADERPKELIAVRVHPRSLVGT